MTILVPMPSGSATTDQSNIDTALLTASSLSQTMEFPESQVYQVTTGLVIAAGGPIPRGVRGNGAELRATTNGDSVVQVTNPHAAFDFFTIEDLTVNANSQKYRALSVTGMQLGILRKLRLLNATSICFAIDAATGYGVYYNHVVDILMSGSQWLGAKFSDNLTDYAHEGSHIQGNTIQSAKVVSNASGCWLSGMQDSLDGWRIERSQNVGLAIDHCLQFDLKSIYFENNFVGTVDTAIQVDPTANNVFRWGGQWNGAVIGTVITK
jgi:hypothetical protein